MTQRSLFWDGATGDCGPYSSDEMMNYVFRAVFGATGNLGVLNDWLNELEVTNGGVNTATVATGGALVYGMFYENDAALNVNVPNGPRTDLIVVRRSWAAQTCRITRIAGPGAALTQNAGVTWDIPLASVVVNGAGALTITDTREICQFPFWPGEESIWVEDIADSAIGTSELENQDRWRFHGVGELMADVTNPPVFGVKDFETAIGASATVNTWWPYNMGYRLEETVTDAVWLTEKVPEDISAATLTVYAWNMPAIDDPGVSYPAAITGNVMWGYEAWLGATGVAWNYHSGTIAVSNAGRLSVDPTFGFNAATTMYRDAIANIAVSAGQLLHLKVYRAGSNVGDTCNHATRLMGVELAYEADS